MDNKTNQRFLVVYLCLDQIEAAHSYLTMASVSSAPSLNALDQYDLTGKVGGFLDRHLLLRALEFLEDNNV
jgi:hypothetical protein